MQKLSGPEFIAGAMAGTTPAEVDALRARLAQRDTSAVWEALATIRRLGRFLQLPSVSEPPWELRQIRWAFGAPMLHGFDPMAYVVLAAEIAVSKHPEAFGHE